VFEDHGSMGCVKDLWAVSRILDCSSWLSWLSRSLRLVVSEGFGRSAVAEV